MAAGRQNFSRKRQETFSSRSRHVGRSTTEVAQISVGRAGDYRRKSEVDDYKTASVSLSTKKRKCSPILWDRVEKQVRVSSKNRVVHTSSVISCSPSPNSIESSSVANVSSVESCVSNVSDDVEKPISPATRILEEHDQEIENEDGECVGVRNLSKSKWAFNDSPRFESDVTNSSPESGEFIQEAFETNEEASSLSTEDPEDNVSDNNYETLPSVRLGIWPSCRDVTEFERLGKISEGTYGVVHKGRDKKTGDIVALKKVKLGSDREGFPVTALREINVLGILQHPSLVEMKEVVTDDFDGVYMVMEFVDHELKGYMERMKQPFSQSEVKRLMIQLLEGVCYLHDNYVLHRDLKTSNLLLNNNGELKICDLGMARHYTNPLKPYTPLVVTLWYRAPELLLGMKKYSTAIDMWSVGCIMAELLSNKPLFDGNKELEQIDKIFRTLGTPSESIWPGYSKLPGVKPNFVKQPYNLLRKKFPAAVFTGSPTLTELGLDLLNKFLTYDPEKRISAREALDHGWFRESPLAAEHVRICK